MEHGHLVLCLAMLCSVFDMSLGDCAIPGYIGPIQMHDWTGQISSPTLDNGMYENFQDCTWEIQISPGSKVKITLTMFDLEEGSFINNSPSGQKLCLDYVKIKDTSGTLFEQCGAVATPIEVTSSSEAITVYFHTDDWGASKGFTASYTGICEAEITSTSVLSTPNYPNAPPEGVVCKWGIRQPSALVNIIKAISATATNSNGDDKLLLPDCGKSPIKIIFESATGERSEICVSEAVQGHAENVTIVYDATAQGIEPWVGQLRIDFTDEQDCSSFCVHSTGCQPTRALNRIRYNCICQEGYEGLTCEDQIDSCNSNPCQHASTCENLPGVGSYNCKCEPSFSGRNCETPLADACSSVTCYNSGVCVVDKDGQPYCKCMEGGNFTGQFCTIPIDSAHCVQELDEVPGSHILWSDTLATQYDVKPCPKDVTGNATRNCIVDPHSPTGGLWTRPDLSMCVSPEILHISEDAQALMYKYSGSKADLILNIADRLANSTDPLLDSTPEWHPLFPGDLLTVASVMETISDAADRETVEDDMAKRLTQKYSATVDNIVDPKTVGTWRNARANLVEDKISKLMSSTQKLVTSVSRTIQGRPNGESAAFALPQKAVENIPLLQISARNLDIQVTQLSTSNLSRWAYEYFSSTSSIFLPSFTLPDQALSDSPVSFYFAKFMSISSLLSIGECRYHKQHQNDSNLVNSDVISAEVLDVPKSNFKHLRRPVILTFLLKDPKLKGSLEEQCVFMNMSATSYENRWSSAGCDVAEANDTHVTCHCYHLTNFAVLMDIYGTQDSLDPAQDIILTYISYIGGCLSILACIITIGTFQYFGLSSDRVRIHQQFGLSIILVQVLFICIGKTGKEYGTSLVGCRIISILAHYCLTAMFCWMLVEGMHLYVVLVRVFKQGSHLKKYIAVGWGVPLIVVGISVGAFYDRYGNGDLCWLDHDLLLICFVPTVGLVVMINTVILVVVIRVMFRSNSSTNKVSVHERNSLKMGLKAATVLLPLLGLTWTLGFLAIDMDETKVLSYIFTYLFTIVNSFQGVLFFVFHCLLNVDVHQAYERRYRRKKRLSYAETTSSRLRKLSEPEFYNGSSLHHTHSKSTNTTRSTLTDLSLMDHRSRYPSIDKYPIISVDDMDTVNHFMNPWARFSPERVPEPDYPTEFPQGGLRKSMAYSSKRSASVSGDNAISGISIPRPQRNSVQFSSLDD